MYYYFYQLLMVFSLLASISIVVLMWGRRRAPGGREMIALAIATFIWTLGFYLESHSDTLERQLVFNNSGYIGVMSVPVAWFLFSSRYTRGAKSVRWWKTLLLCIIPLTAVLLVWTNDWHHLMWHDEHLTTSGPFLVTVKTYGPLFWVAAIHNYILTITGAVILIWRLFFETLLYRKQAIVCTIAVSLPLIWNIIFVFNLVPLPRKDLSPAVMAISGIAIVLGLIRFRLFKAVPFAHRFVFEQLNDGVFVFDAHDHLLEANPVALKMAGLDRNAIGKKLKDLSFQSPLLERITLSQPSCTDLMLKAAGKECYYEQEIVPMYDNKEQAGWLAILHDITQRKQMEKERLEMERKAQNAARLATIGEMAASIAHEINNPLTPALGFSELLMQRDLPEDIAADLDIIHQSTARAADVTKRLLSFARQSKPMRRLCSMNEIIESTLHLRAYHLQTSNVKVFMELDAEIQPIIADAGQLQQVFLNIIMNAEYVMGQSRGGNFLIKTEKAEDIIRIYFKDDGPGIAKENLETIFLPFFTSRKSGEGTGLGLSICRDIVSEHKGKIYAESEPGKGAAFIIELPIANGLKEDEVGT